MLFECSLAPVEEAAGASCCGSLLQVIEHMERYSASCGEVIDIVLPFHRIDLNALNRIGHCIQAFICQGACIRSLNFDPQLSRGRARMEHSVLGEAADIGDEGVLLLYQLLTSLRRTGPLEIDAANYRSCIAASLESLHLGHCSIEQSGVLYLSKLLSRLANLQSLHLSNNEGIGSNFVHLAEQLQTMTNLKDLNLTQCSLGSHGAKVLSAILPYMPSLEKLHLTYNHISSGSMERVCAQFSLLTNLRFLFLSYNSLGNSSKVSKSKSHTLTSCDYLNSGVSFCSHLTVLHLHHCTLGESGVCVLLESAVSQSLVRLESLRIDHNGVQPNSTNFVNALVRAIRALKCICQLWFRQVGLHFIEKSGSCSIKLDEAFVPISTSGMNDHSARAILEELLKCERMTFDSRSIDDDVLAALAVAFHHRGLVAPLDWNLPYHQRTFFDLSKTMFSRTIDLATSGSIKEIFESNIILHERIGQGGFGTVYKATWIHAQEPNELVAVKIVPFLPDDEELETELSIMNKVKQGEYDNLVHVRALYFFEDHSWHCQPAGAIKQSRMGIVMNWYKDGSLRTLLNQTQHHMRGSARLSWTDKLQLAIDVCVGLGKLHDMALLHRDVKADNVLLKKMEDGRMRGYLCDFGISASKESVNVRKQKGFGTLIFCAPELFGSGPSKFSVQSDIYAFGMLLYELMTHHLPFENFVTESPDGSQLTESRQHWSLADIHKPGNEKIASRISKKAVANLCIPESIRLESPEAYLELLKNCISFTATDRPKCMDDIRSALEQIRSSIVVNTSSQSASSCYTHSNADSIPVLLSREQVMTFSEALKTESANVTSFMRPFVVSMSFDEVERKHESAGGDAAADIAALDSN